MNPSKLKVSNRQVIRLIYWLTAAKGLTMTREIQTTCFHRILTDTETVCVGSFLKVMERAVEMCVEISQ